MRTVRPTALMATVLPPVLGPVMRTDAPRPSSTFERHGELGIEERMLAPLDRDEGGVGRGTGKTPLHVVGHTRLRESEVELGGRLDAAGRFGGDPSHRPSELSTAEDPCDPRSRSSASSLAQGVAELKHVLRLYEEGLSRGRGVVDDALDLAPVLGLERHHVTSVADGVDRVAQQFAEARVV